MSNAASSWDVLARAAATRETSASETRALRELLVFSIDGAPYALPIERIREIVRPRALTPVPHVPSAVLGVISLRGEIYDTPPSQPPATLHRWRAVARRG